MQDFKKISEKVKKTADTLVVNFAKHRFLLLFAILGAAIGFALYRTSMFIDIKINQTRYTEEAAKIKYKSIDKKIMDSFSEKQNDADVNVDTQFDPSRNNPFVD